MYILSPTRHLVFQIAPFITQTCNVYIFVHTKLPAQTVTVHFPFLMNCYKNSTPVTVSSYCQQPQYYQPYKTTKSLMSHRVTLFYVLLTVHLSITSANDQLDTQFFYFIIHLLQSSTCFAQRRAHHQEVKFY
jgi:hypothetical protein